MSFSDFSSSRRAVASSQQHASAPNSGGLSASGRGDALSQISDVLLQYQRNVGILEKIVQALSSSRGDDELSMQYKAQVDVISQLQEKLTRLLQQSKSTYSSSSQKMAAIVKLQRDYERVQARALALQQNVTKMQLLKKAAGASRTTTTMSSTTTTVVSQNGTGQVDSYQQIQVQLQHDRLQEEIMREREEEIRNINRGMHKVNEIYKDLAHIVGSQQEDIDRIETQMEDAHSNAQSGLRQVEKANEKYGQANCTIS